MFMYVGNESYNQGQFKTFWAVGQCSVQGPRAVKNVMRCGCVLDFLLFIRTSEDREWKTLFLLHLKTQGALHPSC
jgi:hypothetical protein